MLDGLASSLAGQLPQGSAVNPDFENNTKHCGSRLAGDGGGSDDKVVGCAGLIAGKPAPTGICGEPGF
jgi:hypothetical protein